MSEDSNRSGFVPWPEDQPARYNGSGEPCDMWIGPCSCGATHTREQRQRTASTTLPTGEG